MQMLWLVIWVKHVVLEGDRIYGKKEDMHILYDKIIHELQLS